MTEQSFLDGEPSRLLDAQSGRVVGRSIDATQTSTLVTSALCMAIARPTRPWREATQDGSVRPAASSAYKIWAVFRAGAVEGSVDDHILLAADESAPAGFEKDGPGVDAVPQCCGFSVAQKTRVNAAELRVRVSRSTRTGRSCRGLMRFSAASWRANRLHPCCQPWSEATAMKGAMGQGLYAGGMTVRDICHHLHADSMKKRPGRTIDHGHTLILPER